MELRNFFADEFDVDKPVSGLETSCSCMEADSEQILNDLAAGKGAYIRYIDIDMDDE